MVFEDGDEEGGQDDGRVDCGRWANRPDLCPLQYGQLPRRGVIAELRTELAALENFYADFGMPLEKYARPHLLRVVTGMKRDIIEIRRRLLMLEDKEASQPERVGQAQASRGGAGCSQPSPGCDPWLDVDGEG